MGRSKAIVMMKRSSVVRSCIRPTSLLANKGERPGFGARWCRHLSDMPSFALSGLRLLFKNQSFAADRL